MVMTESRALTNDSEIIALFRNTQQTWNDAVREAMSAREKWPMHSSGLQDRYERHIVASYRAAHVKAEEGPRAERELTDDEINELRILANSKTHVENHETLAQAQRRTWIAAYRAAHEKVAKESAR